MIRMAPLLASQPRLEKICKDWKNRFLPSCFTTFSFKSNENDSINEFHEKANDLEYLIKLCGSNLTYLNVTQYPISQIMPIINANCPNLETLYLEFKEIMSQDFENVFSNMSHLRVLWIEWDCGSLTLPMTLAKSLEQIGGTLESLELSCCFARNYIFLPDSSASVFPRLIALNSLTIRNIGLSQLLLQSIGEIKNLANLKLTFRWQEHHPMFDMRINMYPIGNLKNLKKDLQIIGTYITDIGMSAIDNLQQLEDFGLGLTYLPSKNNEFITDESMQCLFNPKLQSLHISNCIQITDKGKYTGN
ncbi:uncharacterized protein LOC122849431 [Aphidius gifuensis]|uniref:uncharacterized protein LOC122849431 n=1 Tax=Aphidius gifuensis TaxID=684658 RepID=UPI001CDCCE54|nr:uncharacterized protein LOC122849431 [Aphidius gifuensis]